MLKALRNLFLVSLLSLNGLAQTPSRIPVIRATNPLVALRFDTTLYKDRWQISPQVRPDVYEVDIVGKETSLAFITDRDSISFRVKPGDVYNFVILLNDRDSAYTQVVGRAVIPPVRFSDAYKKASDGRTFTEIPEVYELANIVFALTPTYRNDPNAVSRESPYYGQVIDSFSPYAGEPAVGTMDSLLQAGRYFHVKMDAYAFNFDRKGRIVRSEVYDRVSWGRENTLLPYVGLLEEFARKTGFRKFYADHRSFYDGQIRFYRDSANVKEMVSWLDKNFPGTHYNALKVIWSPLVGYNQSANWFSDNNFKEMQAHVNFPYRTVANQSDVSVVSNAVKRGNIVFTEINHAYIGPEADKSRYTKDLQTAFQNLPHWAEGIALKSYGNPLSCFNEYMNWGLVSLRYIDYAPPTDLDNLLAENDRRMTKYRGFKRFTEFDRFLVDLYRNRKPGTTVADLYPQIVAWFVQNK
ncbi:DUF4932 domain-containing protein [Larkinella soli]|uniref:DUF4932 domain-containing protein n=1 Tax=Larkinella soli TaxID=1770527 RepID=UPI000FFB4BE2|nr:DUF4932 domain-containing protein [Larkinella soli]